MLEVGSDEFTLLFVCFRRSITWLCTSFTIKFDYILFLFFLKYKMVLLKYTKALCFQI